MFKSSRGRCARTTSKKCRKKKRQSCSCSRRARRCRTLEGLEPRCLLAGAVPSGISPFTDSEQLLGSHNSRAVALGDLDGDGDLDAFVANSNQHGNRVWLNQAGQFTDSGQVLGSQNSNDVALGDIDGDGDLDAFVANDLNANRVWLNHDGVFHDSGQFLGGQHSNSVALGDLDGDGDLDAIVANYRHPNRIWFREGGVFVDSGQHLGDHQSRSVSLGDLDGDGDLDAFFANYAEENRVWLNDAGSFQDSGQLLGEGNSWDVSLGDLDGDGDLDAFVANALQGNRIWFNQGGAFSDSGQSLGNHSSFGAALGDLDADGDLDAVVANLRGNRVWRNEEGVFVDNGHSLGNHSTFDVALGDVDADGDLDVFAANYYRSYHNRVWLGAEDSLLSIEPLDAQRPEGDTGTTAFTFVVHRRGSRHGAMSVEYSVSGSGMIPADKEDFGGTLPAGHIEFADGQTSVPLSVTVSGDAALEPPEQFTVRLSNPTASSAQIVQAAATGVIGNDDGALPLFVTSLAPSRSGFALTFSRPFQLPRFDGRGSESSQLGTTSVVLRGASSGVVAGTVVTQPNRQEIVFIRTGGILEPDEYTVTIRSDPHGFVDDENGSLDGDGDAIPGGDFVKHFTVHPLGDNVKVLSIPDFVRGAGQQANIPANATIGIPVTVSDVGGVRMISATIQPKNGLLELSSASLGDNMPAGARVDLSRDSDVPNKWRLQFSSEQPLPPGERVIAYLQARVPSELASQFYSSNELIDVEVEAISDGGDVSYPAIGDDALHVAAFFGDLSGDGRVNAIDASRLARFAAQADSGFPAFPLTDPMVIADITGNGRINASDASHIARFAAIIPIWQIPPLPAGQVISPARQETATAARRMPPITAASAQLIVDSHTASSSLPLTATLEQPLHESTVSLQSFVMHSGPSGQPIEPEEAIAVPTNPSLPAQLVQATVAESSQALVGLPDLIPVWQLPATASPASAPPEDTRRALGLTFSFGAAVGDLDGPDALDALAADFAQGTALFKPD